MKRSSLLVMLLIAMLQRPFPVLGAGRGALTSGRTGQVVRERLAPGKKADG